MIDRLFKICTVMVACCCSTILVADQNAYTIRDVSLKESPTLSSANVTALKKDSSVVIQKRQRGWYKVSTSSHQGWLKLLSVRFSEVMPEHTSVKETAHYSSQSTLTTGVRGLSAGGPGQGGKGADFEQVKQFQSNLKEAEAFANVAGLRSKEVRYVEE